MQLQLIMMALALAGMTTAASTCSQACSNDALCCCCENSRVIPGGSGWQQITYVSKPKCLGQNCTTLCKSWVISGATTCPQYHSPAGFQNCAELGSTSNEPNTDFAFGAHSAVDNQWAWQSSRIKGVVITGNRVVAWQNVGINAICIDTPNAGYHCYGKPSYSACLIPANIASNIKNVEGYP